MADPEPTAWELMRILQTVQETLGRMEGRMVTQDALKTYQDSNERRFAQVESNHTAWTVESRGAHTALDGKIDAQNVAFRALMDNYREKQEVLERQARDQERAAAEAERLRLLAKAEAEKKERIARIFQFSMAAFTLVASTALTVFLSSIGAK